MRKIILAVAAVAVLVAAVPAAEAKAATWKHCGSWDGSGAWGHNGTGFGHFDVRALNVSCRTARMLVRRSGYWEFQFRPGAGPHGGGVAYGEGRFWAWTCYYRFMLPEATRHRCRASGLRRIKWVSAA